MHSVRLDQTAGRAGQNGACESHIRSQGLQRTLLEKYFREVECGNRCGAVENNRRSNERLKKGGLWKNKERFEIYFKQKEMVLTVKNCTQIGHVK